MELVEFLPEKEAHCWLRACASIILWVKEHSFVLRLSERIHVDS